MRWETLFADLAGQLASVDAAERDAAVADLTRAESATLTVVDRLRAAVGAMVSVELRGGQELQGEVREVHPQWLLLVASGRDVLVPTAAGQVWHGLGVRASPEPAVHSSPGGSLRDVSLGRALREIARDRGIVTVATAERSHPGRINRVGRDHLDLAPARDEDWGRARRTGDRTVVVGFGAITCVSST